MLVWIKFKLFGASSGPESKRPLVELQLGLDNRVDLMNHFARASFGLKIVRNCPLGSFL